MEKFLMNEIGFEFPLDTSQQWDGFNEPGVAHFSGSPFRSLGREGTQNTLDAVRKGSQARIEIRRVVVETSTIPDLDGLSEALGRCARDADNEGEKASKFFEIAQDTLSKPTLSVLQFADYNTYGVRGPCENGNPYFALMKATGQSKKPSDTSIGSFGIGKFAPYTVSDLRTIFLTTVWADEDKMMHYAQGKSILMSHEGPLGTHRGTGFWGIRKNCQPLVGEEQALPSWLQREAKSEDDSGTTLSILGFSGIKNWEMILAASIAESFFGAICRGNLEVNIEDGPALNKATLPDLFKDNEIIDAIKDQKEEPETFENSGHFLHALSSTESVIEETENAGLGHCRLHILTSEGLPKRVAILRDGMLITSELTGLRRFGEFKEFAAVFECVSAKGNSLLRSMEPPAHDNFEADRLSTPPQQRAGRIALRELAVWVREMLRKHAQDPVADVSEIDELAEFFGDDSDTGDSGKRDGDENPRGAVKIRARPLPKKKVTTTINETGETFEGADGTGADGTDGDGTGTGTGTGGEGGGDENDGDGGDTSSGGGSGGASSATAALALKNVRAVVTAPKKRRIAFTAEATGQVRVELEDSGADTNRPLHITTSSLGTVVDGRVILDCTAHKRVVVDIDLDRAFDGTIRIKANAI
jgi:hypothetical protein